MENKITEKEKTVVRKSQHVGWKADTYVKVKGYCYLVSTCKHHSQKGVIYSDAIKVNEESSNSDAMVVSYSPFQDAKYELGYERGNATQSKIREAHLKALSKFDEMADQLPDKGESYEIKPGQVLRPEMMQSPENRIIYHVKDNTYFYVTDGTLQLGQDNLNFLQDIENKFGIGYYYKKGDVIEDLDYVNNLVIDAHERKRKEKEDRPAREAAEAAEREMQTEAIIKQYPYLKQAESHSGGKHVAVNIRIELKRNFPDVKFNVTSDYSKVDVSWTDGPSKDKIKEITGKYEDHKTDFTGDFRDYTPSLFNKVFGGCNYIFCNREMSDRVEKIITEWVKEKRPGEAAEPHLLSRQISTFFHENDFPAGCFTIGREPHEHGYKVIPEQQPGQPEQQPGQPEQQPEQHKPGDVTVQRNEEKNGIEISFPAKPDQSVLDSLKANGFKWSRYNKVWWAKFSQEKWEFAQIFNPIKG